MNVFNLMSLVVSIHLWNHHHGLCHETIHSLQKFPPFLLFIILILIINDKKTEYKIYPFSKIYVYNTLLLTIGSMMYSRSLGVIHLI